MAITINRMSHNVFGNKTAYIADIALDSSYATGGYDFDTEALFGIHYPEIVLAPPVSGIIFGFNATSKKLLAYRSALAVQQHCKSVLGSANTNAETADGAGLPTNGALISAVETQANIVTALGVLVIAAQPDIARNVCIVVTNDSGGALNLYVGTTSFLVTGTYKGAAQTETISITVTDAQKSVANTPKYRYKYGLKPFSTITTIVQTNYAVDKMANALKISAGVGSKIAILNTLATPAAADIFHADIKGTAYDASAKVDTTYNTVNLGTLTNADDFTIEYLAAGVAGSTEVPNGQDLSALTSVPVMVIGT
jgi:hypothetical protein